MFVARRSRGMTAAGSSTTSNSNSAAVLLLLLVAVLVLLLDGVHSHRLPNQPYSVFGEMRSSVTSPLLAYSFRQSECVAGAVQADAPLNGPALVLDKSALGAVCPSRGGHNNSMIGAGVSSLSQRNAIVSQPMGNTLDALTNPLGSTKAMTIELWFSVDRPFSPDDDNGGEFVLLEYGGYDGSTNSIGDNGNSHQLRLSYQYSTYGNLRIAFRYYDETISFPSSRDHTISQWQLNAISKIGDPAYVGKPFLLVLTIGPGSYGITSYLGVIGESFALPYSSPSYDYDPINNFILPPNHVLRVGCTRSPDINYRRGFPGTYHFLAIYDQALSPSAVTAIFQGGLPNSLPVVNDVAPISAIEDEMTSIGLNMSAHTFDVDGNAVTTLYVNRPQKGRLFYNGVEITSDNFAVSDTELLHYKGSSSNANTTFDCNLHTENDRFTYTASDGLCDRTDTPLGSTNCKSPVPGVARICIQEVNHPPIIVSPPQEFVVFAGAKNRKAFTITCGDNDATWTSYGLDRISIISHNPSLGRVIIQQNGTGDCDGPNVSYANFSAAQSANRLGSLHFCYEAYETNTSTLEVGRDVINYECIDKTGARATGTSTVLLVNPLVSGCGSISSSTAAEISNGIPCRTRGVEDEPVVVRFSGYDAIPSHSKSRRYYKIAALPPQGKLYKKNGQEVMAGDTLPADSQATAPVHEVFGFPGNTIPTVEGDLALIYVPNHDWFNALCDVNQDPDRNQNTGVAICASSEGGPLVYMDGLNEPLSVDSRFPCTNSINGCQLTFSVALGYDDLVQGLRFGPVISNSFLLDIVGKNDEGFLTSPAVIKLPQRSQVDYKVNNANTGVKLRYYDPDGDTYRVAFRIRVVRKYAIIHVYGYYNPIVEVPHRRLTFVEGASCLGYGDSDCFFEGRAFKSDLNRMFDALSIWTFQDEGNDTLIVEVWDPSRLAKEYDPSGALEFYVNRTAISNRIPLLFGSNARDGDDGNDSDGSAGVSLTFTLGPMITMFVGLLFTLVA